MSAPRYAEVVRDAPQTRIERLRHEVIETARGFGPASPKLERALERLVDRAEREETDDLYEAAVREWVARKLRERGHDYTRDDVRNVYFGLEEGWPGTEVTPPEEDYAAIRYELLVRGQGLRPSSRWAPQAEGIEGIPAVQLVQECFAIWEQLLRE